MRLASRVLAALALVASGFSLVACDSDDAYEIVRAKASTDLRCPETAIEVRFQGSILGSCPPADTACPVSYLLLAEGCGAARVYRCDSRRSTTTGGTSVTCAAAGETLGR